MRVCAPRELSPVSSPEPGDSPVQDAEAGLDASASLVRHFQRLLMLPRVHPCAPRILAACVCIIGVVLTVVGIAHPCGDCDPAVSQLQVLEAKSHLSSLSTPSLRRTPSFMEEDHLMTMAEDLLSA